MPSHPVRLALLLLISFGLIGSGLAQRPEDGERDFESKGKATKQIREDLRKGNIAANPKDKEHVEAIEYTGRMLVYPLYWRTATKSEVGSINRVVEEFATKLSEYQRVRPNTNAFIPLLCKDAIVRCAEIINHNDAKRLAGINATRMLALIPQRREERGVVVSEKIWFDETQPRLADGNAELLAETCLTLLNDAKITDGHRYYLYRCLASLLGLSFQPAPILKPDTIDKILLKALEQVEKKVVFPKAAMRQEVEGYKILRQQAILVLAAGKKPVVGDKRPILALARIAGGDADISPAPRLTERVEAAIALTRMAPAASKIADIQFDYAMGAILSTVVEFGKQGNENYDSKVIERLRPWKADAARLSGSLDELKLAVKAPAYIPDAIKECQSKVLSSVETGVSCKFNELADWPTKPASTSLFKSDPATTIKGAAPAPE